MVAIGIRKVVKAFHFFTTLSLLLFIGSGISLSQTSGIPPGTIKIGLLIQNIQYTSSVQGAELAVRIANEKGGMNGLQFQLIVRSLEGPWGTGSKQAVDLIFEEKVWALLGSHDGRNAHLVEQAATKSTVVFVSAWSGDPTLSQAFVPWFFNCVPNDFHQSSSITDEICKHGRFKRIAIIYGNDYDSKMAFNNFNRAAASHCQTELLLFNYESYNERLQDITGKLNEVSDCVVLLCPPAASLKVIREIKKEGLNLQVFGSLSILNENELSGSQLQEFDNALLVPAGEWPKTENDAFRKEFNKIYGKPPGISASYAFDGMNILIEAIRKAGIPEREKIQKSLEKIRHKGVTGLIQFDERGNRSGNFILTGTKDGLPVRSD